MTISTERLLIIIDYIDDQIRTLLTYPQGTPVDYSMILTILTARLIVQHGTFNDPEEPIKMYSDALRMCIEEELKPLGE